MSGPAGFEHFQRAPQGAPATSSRCPGGLAWRLSVARLRPFQGRRWHAGGSLSARALARVVLRSTDQELARDDESRGHRRYRPGRFSTTVRFRIAPTPVDSRYEVERGDCSGQAGITPPPPSGTWRAPFWDAPRSAASDGESLIRRKELIRCEQGPVGCRDPLTMTGNCNRKRHWRCRGPCAMRASRRMSCTV